MVPPIQVALLTIGTLLLDAVDAADYLTSLTHIPSGELLGHEQPALTPEKTKDAAERPLIGVTVADARFAKPLDVTLLKNLALTHDVLVVAEEGSTGGFCGLVVGELLNSGTLDAGTAKVTTAARSWVSSERSPGSLQFHLSLWSVVHSFLPFMTQVRCLTMPDAFVDAGTRQQQLQQSGLTSQRFVDTVLDLINKAP